MKKIYLLVGWTLLIPMELMAGANSCDNTAYQLRQGWNLISFSADPLETPMKLLQQIPHARSLWTYADGRWYSVHREHPNADMNPIADIEPGRGYWLSMDADVDFQTSDQWQSWTGNYDRLEKGWNLLGANQSESAQSFVVARGGDQVWGWDDDSWKSYLVGVPLWLNSIQSVECGKGYYLFAEQGNRRPMAYAAEFELDEDASLTATLQGEDEDSSDTLAFVVATTPQYGELTLNSSGDFKYQPGPNYFGQDEFTFVVNDGFGDSIAARVSLTILPLPDTPTAGNMSLTALESGPAAAILEAGDPDGESVEFSIASQPARGTVSIEDGGLFFYSPNAGESGGEDQFSYRVTSGGESATATVTIQLSGGVSEWDQMVWDQGNWE